MNKNPQPAVIHWFDCLDGNTEFWVNDLVSLVKSVKRNPLAQFLEFSDKNGDDYIMLVSGEKELTREAIQTALDKRHGF